MAAHAREQTQIKVHPNATIRDRARDWWVHLMVIKGQGQRESYGCSYLLERSKRFDFASESTLRNPPLEPDAFGRPDTDTSGARLRLPPL